MDSSKTSDFRIDGSGLVAIYEEPTGLFHNLVAAAGLDPKSDFKNRDLRVLSFVDAHVDGFDFSGSDLRGTGLRMCARFGVNMFTGCYLDPEDHVWLNRNAVAGSRDLFELRLKINGLMDWARESGIRDLSSLHAISRSIDMRHSTLRDCISMDRMSVAQQKALAAAFGFDIAWLQWRDARATKHTVSGQRTDSAKAFIERFIAHSKSNPRLSKSNPRLTIAAGLTNTMDRRLAEFSFGLADSFDPAARPNPIPLVLSLSFDPRGWPVFFDPKLNLTIRLTNCDVQLFHERPSAAIEASDIACDHEAEGNFHGRVGLSAWWSIGTTDRAVGLAGRRRRNEGEDCLLRGFMAGDQIRALMTARVSDFLINVGGEEFTNPNFNIIRERLIAHMLKLGSLNSDTTEVILGEQLLKVIEAP